MPPTRTRHGVIFFAVTLGIITYIDRVCISKSQPFITHDLGLTEKQMGTVFGAFGLSYALCEIPMGWLGDRIGPRRMLMRVVSFWSLFTALTGYAWNYVSMVACRFLFGAGEAGAFPNITKMFTIWLPRREHGMAQGITWLSARWGGAFTPLLVVWVLSFMDWRHAFLLFGGIGVLWAVLFYKWFRDNPREHPGVNEAELELMAGCERNLACHAAVPWGRFLRSPTVLLLWLYYFCISYVWYFYITWLPKYMTEALHFDPQDKTAALLGGLPLLLGGMGCFIGGWLAQRLTPKLGGLGPARRLVGVLGSAGAGAMLVIATFIGSPVLAMIAMGLSGFCNDLTMSGAWGACMDVGGKNAGTLSGSMNMMGNLGGALGPYITPYILDASGHSWNVVIWVAAGTYAIALLCWVFIDPVTEIE